MSSLSPTRPLDQGCTPFVFQPRTRIRALFFGLALALSAPVLADNLPDIQRLIKQAQYPQALDKVESYLSNKPKDAQGRFLKGLILTEMGKPNDAITVFTKLTEDFPELPEPYNNLAVLYAQQKQYDKARTALEMAIRTHPAYAIAYENLGDIYAKLASQAYDKALQLDSANSTAQNKLALIRDLVSTAPKPNVKPTPPAAPVPAAAPVIAKALPPAATPVAAIVASTPGAAASVSATATAAAAPKASAESKTSKSDSTTEEVLKALSNWAEAWSRKDMKAYLGAYAADFNPPKGQSRKAWEAERHARITGKGGKISITYDEPQITLNGDKATVKFKQSYTAPGLKSTSSKTLVFVRASGKWLIQEENAR